MRDHLKILDCNRKGILGLPDGALKVWMTRYMMEDDEQESWLSLPEIEALTGQAHPTNVKWHQYLVQHGWLVDTDKTAHDKLLALGKTPSANSKQVKVYRVDDPARSKIELVENTNNTEPSTSSKIYPSSKIEHKVYGSSSGSCSSSFSGYQSSSQAWPNSTSVSRERPAEKLEKHEENQKTKPQTKTNRKSVAPDGTSWSEWDAHDQVWKTQKLIEHGVTQPGPSAPRREEPKGKTKTDDGFIPRCAHMDGKKRCFGAGEYEGYCLHHAGDL
jgi:hypothetical protein